MLRFIRQNRDLLGFGFVFTLFSSFGQTFLLSLYIPELAAGLSLSLGVMGSLYATATLGSAALLSWLGRYIDFLNLRKYSLLVVAGYVFSLVMLALSHHAWLVVLGLLGLRLCGQGLSGHIAVTTMARYFDRSRGKAISLATLGFPAGEAVLPVLVALLIGGLGWRGSLGLTAIVVGLVLPLSIWWFLRHIHTAPPLKRQRGSAGGGKPAWYFLRTRQFWVIAPNVFFLGFINTALFFYQVDLGQSRGWSVEWVAASLAAFAAASALSMFISGPLVDRWTAQRVYPHYLWPYLTGLVLLVFIEQAWVYPVTLFLLGLGNGMGSTVKNALQAELFGINYLGSVRSLFTVLMVVSTALGPLVFGLFIDRQVSYAMLLAGSAVAIALCILQSFRIRGISARSY